LSTSAQCDSCHTTNGWAPANFKHDPNGDYPGNHRRDPGCNGCHGNTISASIPWPRSQYAPFCAACHASDFKRKDKHIGGENGTVAQNKNCGGSGCHRVSDRGFD
jgi:predicted CXXCH cytochrome family protein